ncbi:hypothetical protein BURMUCGD2M_0940 [Burkholderia multivorans CGD2M]|uniref:Uncharacterized protein n=1 Tax=Burkholderia multivorans CGD2 TaxID=513052 RepID=B9BTH1_9BURK|nr:hypothetical protein BURMUCGD2_0848 [Burkholderia multivorans CGD2]EEE12842.1 hypothetical protein BURMUCGD2M_0940 [Burkholderia multivorans CGD2M]
MNVGPARRRVDSGSIPRRAASRAGLRKNRVLAMIARRGAPCVR